MLHIRINREGIYDREEFFARKFFQAFEILADETRTQRQCVDGLFASGSRKMLQYAEMAMETG